jgi:hypothetical protein
MPQTIQETSQWLLNGNSQIVTSYISRFEPVQLLFVADIENTSLCVQLIFFVRQYACKITSISRWELHHLLINIFQRCAACLEAEAKNMEKPFYAIR